MELEPTWAINKENLFVVVLFTGPQVYKCSEERRNVGFNNVEFFQQLKIKKTDKRKDAGCLRDVRLK